MDYLSSAELKQIKSEVAFINQEYSIDTPGVLRDEIFDLLEKVGTLIFFPLNETELWGIYVYKNEKNYFIINTSIEIEKQVFAAAHELAHSFDIAKVGFEIITSNLMTEYIENKEFGTALKRAELIANRFAAELLISSKKLSEKYAELPEIYSPDVKVAILSDVFLVPFKAIVKRLHEVGGIVSQEVIDELLSLNQNEIKAIAERYEICERNYEINEITKLGGYVNKALVLYENELSTYEELENKLKLIGKKPEEFNVTDDNLNLIDLLINSSESPDWEDDDDDE